MSMTLNFLGGAPFQLLYDGVKLAISNTSKFKTHLRSLKFTLDCLQPQIIEQIRLQNLQLNIPVQEIQELQRKIYEGIALVGQLSSINTCNIRVWGSCCSCLMVSYADQLDELNESLRRLFEILRLQSLAQINQTAILARTTRDRQDELERKQLRIIDMLMKQQQILERIEENSVAASTGNGGAPPVQVLRLGAVFQALLDAVVQVKVKNSKFKRLLEDFKFTLECLKPLVQEIVECNKVLHFPKEEILEDFIEYLEKGVDVVYKCSKSSLWNRFKKYECINSVFELDESLQRLFNILRLQIENDVKEALVSVSNLEKEIKEIEDSFVLQHHQYESAAAELQLPKVESDVMNVQETRDLKQSMDSTGNVEVGDGSHKQFGGSSLELQRIDVAVEEPPSPTTALDHVMSIPEVLDSARNNMEVGLEETGGKGKRERETRLVPCKAVEQETLARAPIVPVLASQKRNASLVSVLLSYAGISENRSRSTVSQTSRSTVSQTSRSTVSQTSSSTGRSQYSHSTEATTSTLSPRHDDQESTDGEILGTSNLKIFSFADMKSATKNFSSGRILGEGGFGRVFRAWVDEKTLQPCKAGTGMIVAVKKLSPESLQGFQEWQSEVNFLGRLSHPNLVKLLGYCCEEKELLLVYEFMQKGSLENHLFRRSPNIEPLSWDIRIRIAIGAARGLAFLHSSENPIIHRDPKASNILLDGNYNAKISGFGLAKLGLTGEDTHGDTCVSPRIMGTYGYAAPEYIATGHLCVKSDVYGFGVVLLEILTGLRAVDTKRPKEQLNLVDWAKPLLPHRRKLKTIMDARMEGQYSFKAALQTATITLKCLASDPKRRPSMKEVLEELEPVQAIREKSKPALLDISRLHISSPR